MTMSSEYPELAAFARKFGDCGRFIGHLMFHGTALKSEEIIDFQVIPGIGERLREAHESEIPKDATLEDYGARELAFFRAGKSGLKEEIGRVVFFAQETAERKKGAKPVIIVSDLRGQQACEDKHGDLCLCDFAGEPEECPAPFGVEPEDVVSDSPVSPIAIIPIEDIASGRFNFCEFWKKARQQGGVPHREFSDKEKIQLAFKRKSERETAIWYSERQKPKRMSGK